MTKLRLLGIGLVALLATGAFSVMNAGATAGGHFIAEQAHTIIKSKEVPGTAHQLEFQSHGLNGGIICDTVSYSDHTTSSTTETQVKVTPSFGEKTCHTTGSAENFNVDANGCHYGFTVAPGGDTAHHTVHLTCPEGKYIEITHPNCYIRIYPQTVPKAVTYKTITENNKHAITVTASAQFNTHYVDKICVFTGTNHVGTLSGAALVRGVGTGGEALSITAT